ncbi:MAG: VCBS repeat-containing protein, partial [Gammaproteobacteria bacterium]|nr:VCBS repeat-containing protein [Gammaproteobacteria bacterium]
MVLRTLIITGGLLLSVAATAQDMSTWSDRSLCRLQNTLVENALYHAQVRSRGLVCPPVGSRETPYRKAFYQSTSAQCQPSSLSIEDNLPATPSLDLRDHIAVKSSIIASHTTAELLIAHDFNGDGIDDLMVNAGLPETNLILLTGQPSGLFIDQALANAKGATGELNRLQLIDANQDQWPDLLAFNVSGPIQLFINQQGQGFKAVLLAAEHLPTGSMGGVL